MTSNTDIIITEQNTSDIIKEVQDAFFDIPFENSAFQTENFVIANQITPERAYRAIGLRMNNKLIAVQESLIDREITLVEEDELRAKINDPQSTSFEIRKAELELKKKQINKPFHNKLINDAIQELNILYKHFKALPKYTREEFEAGEYRHFLEDLNRQELGMSGAKESLINMLDDIKGIERFENNFASLPESKRNALQELTDESLSHLFINKDKNKLLTKE